MQETHLGGAPGLLPLPPTRSWQMPVRIFHCFFPERNSLVREASRLVLVQLRVSPARFSFPEKEWDGGVRRDPLTCRPGGNATELDLSIRRPRPSPHRTTLEIANFGKQMPWLSVVSFLPSSPPPFHLGTLPSWAHERGDAATRKCLEGQLRWGLPAAVFPKTEDGWTSRPRIPQPINSPAYPSPRRP